MAFTLAGVYGLLWEIYLDWGIYIMLVSLASVGRKVRLVEWCGVLCAAIWSPKTSIALQERNTRWAYVAPFWSNWFVLSWETRGELWDESQTMQSGQKVAKELTCTQRWKLMSWLCWTSWWLANLVKTFQPIKDHHLASGRGLHLLFRFRL